MTRTDTMKRLRPPGILAAALALTALAAPALAKDIILDCPGVSANEEHATVVFHPTRLGIDAGEDDGLGDMSFEHIFSYHIKVEHYDPAKPGWTGPKRCEFNGAWKVEDMVNNFSQGGWRTFGLDRIVYLRQVPRTTRVSIDFSIREEDNMGDDFLDISPYGDRSLHLAIFVDGKTAQTQVGQKSGQTDVTLNQAKRIVGNGGGDTNAYIEFIANVHPQNWKSTSPWLKLADPNQVPGAALKNPGKAKSIVPTPDTHPQCKNYALKSVQQNQEQAKLGCGFQPPAWSNDHQMHFDWCVKGNNAAGIQSEIGFRDAQLAACKQAKASAQGQPNSVICNHYATVAMATIKKASGLTCALLQGPRWVNNYNAHYNWCMSAQAPLARFNETVARNLELKKCGGTW